MNNSQLKEQIKKLPIKSGIYLFKNSKNRSLYIGKALNLRNRVRSYLKTNGPSANWRIQQMILETKKVDFIETGNDIEALILESQYIKKCKPDFNIMLRDDKQYFYVGFSVETFPKIFLTHQPFNSTEFVGPFTDGLAIKTTLRLLRKIFPYCTCKQTHHNYCLNYHIGKCPGFCCCPKDSPEQSRGISKYQKNIKAIKDILSGKKSSLIKNLEKEMKTISAKQEYEKALELQYKIEKLKRTFQNAQIIKESPPFMIYHKDSQAMDFLQTLLNLRPPLRRIECYDIANIQGKHAVGVMVVFSAKGGLALGGTVIRPDKNEYRKFKIYTRQTPDDTGMLKEVLTRRFNHPEWPYPDLVIIDGGKGQLNTVKEVLRITDNELRIMAIALTKNEHHIGHKLTLGDKEILLSKLSIQLKNFLIQIDSEAHRFAISYYRRLHRKSIK